MEKKKKKVLQLEYQGVVGSRRCILGTWNTSVTEEKKTRMEIKETTVCCTIQKKR